MALLWAALLLSSCGWRTAATSANDDTIVLKYAQYLRLVRHDGYVEAVVLNPWRQGTHLHDYYLVPRGKEGDEVARSLVARRSSTPNVDIIRTPIRSSVVTTSPHCQLLYELGCQQSLRGVCDLDYILIPDVHRRASLKPVQRGAIQDCGQSMQPVVERIIALQPEALLLSPFENSGGYGKLDRIGIPIVETADYMETSPLGRAEWMKFYGLLFLGNGTDGRAENRADSLFASIERGYLRLKSMAARLPMGRSILTERKTGGVWYVPGGKSTVGVLLADAHARYVFAHDNHSGSLALNPEQVIERGADIDVWAFKYFGSRPVTRGELLQEYSGYKLLRAMQTGDVYEASTSDQPYFEQTSFHPELLLREFIILAHPGFHKLGQLKYYRKE